MTVGVVRPRLGAGQLAPLLAGWRDEGRSGYRALAERLRLLVLDGRVPVNTVLPSERALAEAVGASRTTTTAAYRLLRELGFAAGSQGSGTWTTLPDGVRGPAPRAPWPGALDPSPSSSDGRGDLSIAAPEAPAQLHAAYSAALAELPRFLGGPGYVTQGLSSLRERIAARYTERGLPTSPEEILVTNGALQGLRLVMTTLGSRGDRVVVEHPTYPAAVDCIRRAGGRPVPLPVEDGWDAERLRAVLRQTGARTAYLMVDFHNPTGQVLSRSGRVAVGAALAEAGVTTVVDETNCELDLRALLGHEAEPVTPMGAFLPAGSVVCLGSASKAIWGGLRVGWVRAERSTIVRLAMAREADDISGPVLEQLAASHLLGAAEEIVGERRRRLASRCVALRGAVRRLLPEWDVPEPSGGMVLWCRLPTPSSSALTTAAGELGLRLTPGPRFGLDGAFETRIRLPYGRPAEHLEKVAELLVTAWARTASSAPSSLVTSVV